ncbi:MAG: hypothetical protein ABH827_03020 [bacterium]
MANRKNSDLQKNHDEATCADKDLKDHYQPVINFFALLLEWEKEEVHEKNRKSKKVSTPSQYENH